MRCPVCSSELKQQSYHGLSVDVCSSCDGIWFDLDEVREYIGFLLRDKNDIPHMKIELDKEIMTRAHVSGKSKNCPRCGQVMKKFNYAYDSNVILDKCSLCGGIWCDEQEIYKLAIYIKGNPRMDDLGRAIVEEKRKSEEQRELANSTHSLGTGAMVGTSIHPIVYPREDDLRTNIVPWGVIGIILTNMLVFLCQLLYVKEPSLFFNTFGLVPSALMSGKGHFFSFLTSMFIHGGLFHLVGNMYFFWIFGDNVEEFLGHFRFLGFYFMSGLFASILHVFVYMGSDLPTVGASGAIAGAMGAYFILFPHAKIKTFVIHRVIDIPAYLYLGGWILLQVFYGTLYFSMGVSSGVAWFAHIGGFVSGLILAWLYKRYVFEEEESKNGAY